MQRQQPGAPRDGPERMSGIRPLDCGELLDSLDNYIIYMYIYANF